MSKKPQLMKEGNNVLLRMALPSDVPALLPLLDQLGYPTLQETLEKRFKKFIENDGYGVALALLPNDRCVGCVAWSKTPLFVSEMTRIHIEGLVVEESYRSQGVGKKLMTFVEAFAHQFKPVIIDLTSGLRRAPEGTHDFYQALGYHNNGPMAKVYLRKEL